ncbi:UNVERIFIED_CONTAM: Ras-related protein RABE1c, partial [Sesamum calycinum]
VWVRVVFFCDSLMVPSRLVYYHHWNDFKIKPLNLMASGSNSRSGIQLGKNDFEQSPQRISSLLYFSSFSIKECFIISYYRGAMGILLVYDVTDESSFNNIRNWIRNIEQHASDNVNKILVGNKADMDESKRAVPTSKGQALADEYGIKFFETSAKTNLNVEEVFFSIARDIKQRLSDSDTKAEPTALKINQADSAAGGGQPAQKSSCCAS